MSNAALKILHLETSLDDGEADILSGLREDQKRISPKYFYDDNGSRLFESICSQPEYYPTRTEFGIMKSNIGEISELIGPRASIIEFGSGSSVKTRMLLAQLTKPAAYVPVDISREPLAAAAQAIATEFSGLEVLPVCADFTQPFDLPTPRVMPERNIVFFPGSTIGNFSREEAVDLLHVMRAEAKENGGLLIGVDLEKSKEILEPAYNDSAGVTADFNLNLLNRLNREYEANFDLAMFKHKAIYDEERSRIEMRLVSLEDQQVDVAGECFRIDEGEYIVTEHSHKYSVDRFESMSQVAGFSLKSVWTDHENLFSVQYLEAI
jgi:L-histidine N-alpha-methyltransferase